MSYVWKIENLEEKNTSNRESKHVKGIGNSKFIAMFMGKLRS